MDARCVIIAAGEGTRWGDYLGVPKHLITLEGEVLLHRSVAQLRRYTDDVWVVGNTDDYLIEGARLYKPVLTQEYFEADKFLSSRELWSEDGRTVIIYGDVWFSESAVEQIMFDTRGKWAAYGRFGPSKVTAKGHGELFAQSFWPEQLEEHLAALWRIVALQQGGRIGRSSGWEHWRAMNQVPDERIGAPHVRLGLLEEIDDWTEDFDTPSDYERWITQRELLRFA